MNKWEKREEEDRYIMERMHPAVMIPGFFYRFHGDCRLFVQRIYGLVI